MWKLIVRRILEAIPLLLAISLVTFYLLFHSPGDFLSALRMDPKIPQEFLDREVARLGLDRPWYEVWARWVWGVVRHGNLGNSFSYKIPVAELIGQRLFNTFLLALSSTLFAWCIAVPLGIIAAVRQNRLADRFASAIAFLGLSVPAVLLALFAVYFAARTEWFPTGGMTSDRYAELPSTWEKMKDIAHHLVLPTIVLGMGGLAIYTRQMRSNLLEALGADYMRTALAKGLSYRQAVLRHALRNALNPMISLFGFAFSDLLSGAFLVENVMAWPGLGRTTIEAYNSKDMFVVAAAVMLASVMLILGNLIADILLALNDPRIRYE
ncbi:Oligopeptide transport system permease protein OppB [Candidatus Sumerlaea chitinivorans]|uniref:Oligopeptide transport system permease protein OppB n=1 Tax=Sumerlaea chitinivorans TaxID=2250252 RepID=A0A2Z4Y6Y7_SUMC1|nr:Oligopeptide transport system permease protein OppB [Candidatus Sumerlaea chitinivorans]